MRKLKVALIAVLAVLMCVGLIACGGKKPEEQQPTDYKVRRIEMSQSSFTLTDADGEDAWKSKVLDKLAARVQYTDPGGNAQLKASGLTVDKSGVQLGSIGVYSATVTPTEHNADNMSATIEINIEHNIVDGVCTEDGATLTTEEIDIGLTYNAFHTGDSTLTANGSTAIRPFGSIMVDGSEERVKTHTVGRLEKGMTITVKGTAITNYTTMGAEEKAYFFPILGFADTSIGEYTGGAGTSVIVRNEGWVLLDGIGAPRLLAALAGNGSGGANDTGNYGSHPSDTGNKPLPGYTDHGEGTPTLEQWHDWYTYSTGETSNTTTYLTEQHIELSWTYREDGIIELTTVNTTDPANPTKLIARTKVPDSAKGYYDTILHGEYVVMHFDEISTLSTRTLESVQFDGMVQNTKKVYLENEMLDLNTLDVKITTKQDTTPVSDTQFDVEANIGTAEEPQWVSLSETPLSTNMKAFRVTRSMGNITKTADIPAEQFITIAKNAVNEAYAHTVEIDGVDFANNATLGQLSFASVTEEDATLAVLTLSGAANTLTDAQKAKLTGAASDKYIALRIWARDGAVTKFKAGATVTVTSGAAAVAGAYVNVTGDYADVVLPVNAEIAEKGVTLAGLTEDGANVRLDLTGLDCLTVTTQVTSDRLYLDKGGNVTVVYNLGAEGYAAMKENIATTQLYANSASVRFQNLGIRNAETTGTGKLGEIDVTVTLNEEAGTVTVVYAIPKFTVTSVNKFDLSLFVRSGSQMVRQATETVYYEMAFAGDNGVGQAVGDNVYVESDGTVLYAVVATAANDISSEGIRRETLNLNVNNGTLESVNFINLGYRYVKGAFMFYGVIPEGAAEATLTTFGTLDNDKDTDYGHIVVIRIDTTKLGVSAAPFYFELNADTSGAPAFILKATDDNKVEKKMVEASSLGVLELISEASCLEKGFASYPYSEEGEVVFYAGLAEVGGAHHFDGDVCTLCGATKADKALAQTVTLNENEFVQVSGTYSAAIQKEIYNGVTLRVNAGDNWYWIRSDSYIAKNDYGSGIDAEEIWHSFDDPEDPTNYALRTPNGKLSGVDGEEINDSLFNEAKRNATFNYYVGYADGVVTIVSELYTGGETKAAYFAFEIRISGVHRTDISVAFGLDAATVAGNARYTTGKIVNSMVEEFGETAFTLKDVTWNVGATYTVFAPANGAVAVKGEGRAFELDAAHKAALGADAKYTHYIAIPVKFTQALASDVFVRVRANGSVLKGALAEIDGDTVYAVIPTDGTVTDFVLDFGSLSANTMQCDLALDLSGVLTTETTSVVTGSPNLISGGDVQIVYTGLTVADTDELEVNGVSAKKSELVAGYDFGNGISVKSVKAEGNTFTVELTVAAPDLTQQITDFTVNYKKSGVIQAQNKFGYLRLPTAPVAGDAKVNDTVYAKAEGSKLTFVVAGVTAGTTELRLNANNGKNIGKDYLTLIQLYDLSFNVSKNGFAFAGNNVLTEKTAVSYSEIDGEYVVMLEVDLTEMRIGERTAYAFEVLPAAIAGSTTVFTVSANRQISDPGPFMIGGDRKTLVESSCDSIGVVANVYDRTESFYYNVSVSPSHTWGDKDANGLRVCSVCGAILKGGAASATTIANTVFAGEEGITAKGEFSVSFFVNRATSDWDSIAVRTVYGGFNITMPNLQMNVNTLPETGVDEEIQALVDKLGKATNLFPSSGAVMGDGIGWDSLINDSGRNKYITVTVSKTTGVTYFRNGVKVIQYEADLAMGGGTVADFVELFLLCAEKEGVIVGAKQFAGQMEISNMILQTNALSEDQAKARYELYEAEKDSLPD